MTEIQFLLDLVLNYKLPPKAKEACLKRIGDVESNLGRALPVIPPRGFTSIAPTQAPSTQAILDQIPNGSITVAPQGIPPAARIVGGEVDTGRGTRGPRKF